MGAAVGSVRDCVAVTVNYPVLFAITIGASVLGLVGTVALMFVPVVGALLVLPFWGIVTGGILGAAYAGLHPNTHASLDAFRTAIGASWKDAAIAYAILHFVYFGLMMLLLIPLYFFMILTGIGAGIVQEIGGAGVGFVVIAALLLVVFLTGLVYVLIDSVLHLLSAAVVIGGHNPTDAYSDVFSLLTEAPLSVLGFSVLRIVLVMVPVFVVALVVTVLDLVHEGVAGLIGLAAFALLLAILPTVWFAYHAAYYIRRRPETVS